MAGRDIFFDLVTYPPRGHPFGGGGIHHANELNGTISSSYLNATILTGTTNKYKSIL